MCYYLTVFESKVVYTEGAKCGFLDPQITGLLASRPAI